MSGVGLYKVQCLVLKVVSLQLGESAIATTIIKETDAEEEEARKFLEDARVTFPQVCDVSANAVNYYT